MSDAGFIVAMTSVSILAAVAVLWMAVYSRSKSREMEHRERLAMIERGLVPSPERDPAGFEQRLMPIRVSQKRSRFRSAGILMVGFGVALAILITFTGGAVEVGVGVGGAFIALGLAFIVNALIPDPDVPVPPADTRTTPLPREPLGPTAPPPRDMP